MNAHEAHAGAIAAALLMFMWGAVSLIFMPARFRPLDATHAAVYAIALGWLVATRSRPRARLAYAFCAVAIVDALAVLPWISMTWCALGRPFEALNVPQVGILTVSLIVPRSLALGVVVMLAFVGEALFAIEWARHVGLGALVPIAEPTITLVYVLPALGLLVLRERRRLLARRYLRLNAESEALARLSPLFYDVRAQLRDDLATARAELDLLPDSRARASMTRSLARLAGVGAHLRELADGSSASRHDDAAAGSDAASDTDADADSDADADADAATGVERGFLAADEQLGATVFAALAALLTAVFAPVAYREIGHGYGVALAACTVVAAAVLALLVATRRHPSQRRGRVAVVALWLVVLVIVSINQRTFAATGRPFSPFNGHKLLMLLLGLASASWMSLGVPLIVFTAVDAIALFYLFGFDRQPDRIALTEPWVTVVFMAIAIAALLGRDQRRVASLALLRAETRVSGLHRRAVMLLGLRDQLNTPLQTLLVGVARLQHQNPSRDLSRLRGAVARLVGLGRKLHDVEIPSGSELATIEADALEDARGRV